MNEARKKGREEKRRMALPYELCDLFSILAKSVIVFCNFIN
jgi:hypothetical protein